MGPGSEREERESRVFLGAASSAAAESGVAQARRRAAASQISAGAEKRRAL